MAIESRRAFLKRAGMSAAAWPLAGCVTGRQGRVERRPNIVFILTDDQGYGDLGCHGNPVLKTPHLDTLHRDGARFTRFHVCPVCSPTRSSLMTGRYNYRTGVVDTFQGRSMMHPDEVTLAEMLSEHGYRTGIFGKWHLGDNYPMRAMDQGFQESLVHKGGGLCQPSEPDNTSYFDPVLKRNGVDVRSRGYCTDVFTDAAIDFVDDGGSRPFFLYLAANAPHEPLEIDEKYWAPYAAQGVPEKTARLYGMVANLDENVGRVLAALERRGIADNTIVIFMTDNGPAFRGDARYNAGLRGQKGSVYEGGIRVPCFVRWPGVVAPGKDIDTLAAHIDLLPTLMDACGLALPPEVRIDGRSLYPLLRGEQTPWPDRTLFFQWHRGDAPEAWRDCAALTQRYKLVNGQELYDLQTDLGETTDVAGACPEVVRQLRAAYEAWFADVCATRGFEPPRIVLGAPQENPSELTRQDWRGSEGWHDGQVGWWEVRVARPGRYRLALEFPRTKAPGEACLQLNGVTVRQAVEAGAVRCVLPETRLPAGEGRVEAWVEVSGQRGGPARVRVERM
jgi:arylsulfatase A-like enzyme